MAVTIQDIDDKTQQGKSTTSKYIVEVRKDICIGAATCVAVAPSTFKMDENNIAVILDGEWDDDDIVMASAQSCPVFAIIVKDAATGKQIFPQQE